MSSLFAIAVAVVVGGCSRSKVTPRTSLVPRRAWVQGYVRMYEPSRNAIICSYINGFAKGGLMDKLRLAAKLPVLVLTVMVTMVYVTLDKNSDFMYVGNM